MQILLNQEISCGQQRGNSAHYPDQPTMLLEFVEYSPAQAMECFLVELELEHPFHGESRDDCRFVFVK
jgi:hypothetical protein